jgi:hypothetical protein
MQPVEEPILRRLEGEDKLRQPAEVTEIMKLRRGSFLLTIP